MKAQRKVDYWRETVVTIVVNIHRRVPVEKSMLVVIGIRREWSWLQFEDGEEDLGSGLKNSVTIDNALGEELWGQW